MRELVEATVGLVHAVRLVGPAQWALRLLLFGAIAGSGWLCALWVGGPLAIALVVVIVGLAVWAVVRPGSPAVLLAVGVVAAWWLFGGVGAWWQAAGLAGVLAVAHLGGALAAAAPSYSAVRSRALRRMLAWTLGYLAACAVGVAVVLAVTALPAGAVVRGPVWVWLGLTALVGAGIWAVAHRRRS